MCAQYHSVNDLIVAVDIGKNVHCVGCYDGQGHEFVAPYEVRSDLPGFQQFRATVDPLLASGRFDRAVLGNEPTGVYHEPWAWQIQQAYLDPGHAPPCPVTYHWVNPLLSKRRREQQSIRKRSTDPLAVRAIAACLADGVGYPAYFPTVAEAQLRQLVRQRAQLQQRLRFWQQQLIPQIDRLWPGALADVAKFRRVHPDLPPPTPLVHSKPLERERVAAFLLHAPNPYTVLAWSEAELIAFLRQHVGRGGPATAQAILTLLRRAPLPPPNLAELYAQRLQRDFQAYHALRARCTALEAEIAALVPLTPARWLDTVPGISPVLAARYLAAIGTVQRFPTAGHIWSYAGFDLVVDNSGDRRRLGQVTKRGPATFRDTLFLIGEHTTQYCPPIGTAFLNARARGLSPIAATLHAAHKANRLCFVLLRDQRPYRPVSPDAQRAFQRRWQDYGRTKRATPPPTKKRQRRRRITA